MFTLVGAEVLFGLAGSADAATSSSQALTVVRDSVDVGLAGTVGLIAVLVGAAGLVFGLTRHRRKSVAQRVAQRAVVPEKPLGSPAPGPAVRSSHVPS
jgi:hypothetical protein